MVTGYFSKSLGSLNWVGVYKNTAHHQRCFSPGLCQQTDMTIVKRAHGRHKTCGEPFFPVGSKKMQEVGRPFKNYHFVSLE